MISGKFAITIHILTLLHKFPNDYLSSEFIAGSINLNPVLVRKEIANLKAHHIVESKEGKNGGTKLAVNAANLTLKEIFEMTFETIGLGFKEALLTLIAGSFGMIAPIQGGIGAYHFMVSQCLVLLGVSNSAGLIYATICHAAQTILVIILGFVALIFSPSKNQEIT